MEKSGADIENNETEVFDLDISEDEPEVVQNENASVSDADLDLHWESLDGQINIEVPEEEKVPEVKYKPERKIHIGAIIFWSCVFVILVLAGINYYIGYKNAIGVFQHNTYINNTDVSCKSAAQVSEELLYENTTFTINTKDGETYTMDLKDMGYVETPQTAYDDLIAQQNPYLWFKYYFEETRYVDFAGVTIEKEDIVNALNNSDLVTKAVKSQNAEIKKNSQGLYELVPETVGNEIDVDKTAELIKATLTEKKYEIDLVSNECYIVPEITQDNETLANLNASFTAIYNEVITIDVTGKTETIDKKLIKTYVELSSDNTITTNDKKINDYVQYLKDTYETLGYSRDFKSTYYGVIKVGGSSNDTYGFSMDFDATFEAIKAAILSGQTQTITPVWTSSTPTRSDDYGDIGNTYIEISINDQHLWYYSGGSLVLETDVITGLSTVAERNTPTGIFYVNDIGTNVNLKGSMGDETWDETVEYWLGFLDSIGMHDASWQTSGFGGQLYTWRGSHGCVNLPTDNMQILYENVSFGTPVIIY